MADDIIEQIIKRHYDYIKALGNTLLPSKKHVNSIVGETFMRISRLPKEVLVDMNQDEIRIHLKQNLLRLVGEFKEKNVAEREDLTQFFYEQILYPSHPLKLYFDLNEFSKEDVVEIISLLSEIYKSIGGDGLEIKKLDCFEYINNLTPA